MFNNFLFWQVVGGNELLMVSHYGPWNVSLAPNFSRNLSSIFPVNFTDSNYFYTSYIKYAVLLNGVTNCTDLWESCYKNDSM